MEILQEVNLASAIELSETADQFTVCLLLGMETVNKWTILVAHSTDFSFEYCNAIFTQDTRLLLSKLSCKKIK